MPRGIHILYYPRGSRIETKKCTSPSGFSHTKKTSRQMKFSVVFKLDYMYEIISISQRKSINPSKLIFETNSEKDANGPKKALPDTSSRTTVSD